ncbi:MAG TPA: FkbM family methyltransferase [Terriglobia bacterium]|nr:FkbM family methyltransferase [Terriglobia bacterium]
MIQRIKDYLVSLGPQNPAVRLALKFHGRRKGFVLGFPMRTISIRRGAREMLLAEKDFYLVPFTLGCFDQTFEDIEAVPRGPLSILDFSGPGSHRYRRHGLTLSFPGAPEDDSIAAYTRWYKPKPGDLVFDMGAHAGFTTIIFSRMVGQTGRIVAFEPDPTNLGYLERNLLAQNLSNVTIVRKAIDARTGSACFNADGTMSAGLVGHSVYGHAGGQIEVETLSLQDACDQYGVLQFIKMDIEGAEVGVVESAADFLKAHPINLAFDSYHRLRDGRFTWMLLEPALRSLGYGVKSEAEFGQMFTWAEPVTRTAS